MEIRELLGQGKKFVIGMVHCLPLPGTAGYKNNIEQIYSQAVQDAKTLERAGVDAIIIENMGDGPFNVLLDVEQQICLAIAAQKVKEAISIPLGIDAAFCDYKADFAIALAVGATFVRVPVFVDTVEFYGGIITPCARDCMLYRKKLNAEHVMILADIQVKHTNMLLPHVSAEQSAKNAVDCGADAIIVTGTHIGVETPIEIIKRVKKVANLPVIAGSGVNSENIDQQLNIADGAIIGSSLKEGGILSNPISEKLVRDVLSNLKK